MSKQVTNRPIKNFKKSDMRACDINVSSASNELMTKTCDNIVITRQMYEELLPDPMKPFRRMAGKFDSIAKS